MTLLIFLPPLGVSMLVGGLLLYFHVDGLWAGIAGFVSFVGILIWELAELKKSVDHLTPGI